MQSIKTQGLVEILDSIYSPECLPVQQDEKGISALAKKCLSNLTSARALQALAVVGTVVAAGVLIHWMPGSNGPSKNNEIKDTELVSTIFTARMIK